MHNMIVTSTIALTFIVGCANDATFGDGVDGVGGQGGSPNSSGGSSPCVWEPPGTGGSGNGTQVALGTTHACAIQEGVVSCWGLNDDYQLGDGTVQSSDTPIEPDLSEADGLPHLIAAGGAISCAAFSGGEVWCWGRWGNDELTPQKADLKPPPYTDLTAGHNHGCAIRLGAVYCFGRNNYGQWGTDSLTGPAQLPTSSVAESVHAEGNRTCATLRNREVWCWGDGDIDPYQVL